MYRFSKPTFSTNIPYNSTGCLDIYHPGRDRSPIVVFFYGDDLFPKHKFLYGAFSNALRELGYVVVVPDHQSSFKDTRELGHGSGAHLIAQVVLSDVIEKAKHHHLISRMDGKHDASQPSGFLPPVEGLLLFSGTYENEEKSNSPVRLIEENAQLFVDSQDIVDLWPRILLLHGQRDKVVHVEQSTRMFDALSHVLPTERREKVDVRMRLYKRMNHQESVTALMPTLFKSNLQQSLKRDVQDFVHEPTHL
ncbi:hypothetical protein BY458DRAFT_434285 [Sporodiniella umbellata]|nr:hypothetical protein BY458DRAFT_434285 [Sporodiniella umbellata]